MDRADLRDKSKAPTDYGAIVSVIVVGGYTFIDRLLFDAYNEGELSEFERVVEMYRSRFGHYPKRIWRIRFTGPKNHAEEKRQELLELGERNALEGKFGKGKHELGLSLIMAKL